MARASDRGSVFERLNSGVIGDDNANGGTPAKADNKSAEETKAGPSPEKSTGGSGRIAGAGSGTGNAGGASPAKPAAPAAVFGTRTAETLGTVQSKPSHGTHPKTGERVEIDWSAEGASQSAPFGTLESGKPRLRRKAARKTRTKTAGTATAAKTTENLTVLTQILQIGHVGIASVLGEHWKLSEDEAEAYADALTDLQAAYDFDVDPKQAAWIKLAMVAGVPTGMRIYATVASGRKPRQKQAPEPQPQPSAPDAKSDGKRVKAAANDAATPSQLFRSMGAGDFQG